MEQSQATIAGIGDAGGLMFVLFEFLARNWALVSILTTVALLIVVPLVILRKYVGIALNLLDDLSPPVWPGVRDVRRPEGDTLNFRAFDGHALRGTLLEAQRGVAWKGAIVFAHEYGMDRWSYRRYGLPLRRAGYDVFTFDFRGHGESPHEEAYKPRQFPSDREQSDMLGAIAFLEEMLEERGRPREVGLFGVSRGGGAAILSAVGLKSVRAIAVDGAFSSDTLLEMHLRKWACIFAKLRIAYENHPPIVWRVMRLMIMSEARKRFGCHYPSVCKALRRLGKKPIFFIHGQRDSYVPLDQAQFLYNEAAGPRYLWMVPGARHNQSVSQQADTYARRVVEFFDRHLAEVEVDRSVGIEAMSDLTQPLAGEETSASDAPRVLPQPEHARVDK